MKTNRWKSLILLATICFPLHAEVKGVKLHGYIGSRIDGCIEKRVKGQNADELTIVFSQQKETRTNWASEFWGKWVQGAIASYQYNHDPELYAKIETSVNQMISYQTPRGFLGDYVPEIETKGWDIWGRKYTLLGLIKWYRVSGDKKALKAACRLLDYTLTQVGPDKKPIYQCGYYRGMPPMSILEPVVFLYNETKDPRYLDFARYIAEADDSEGGPHLVQKCDVPVSQRFPLGPKDNWWSFENGQKGYEMMSCYVGLLELYKVTGHQAYFEAAKKAYQHVKQEEVNITGGACSLECFYQGKKRQTHPAAHTMETCVTFTWMQYAERLLEMTGDSQYADDIEQTMYNALMASMKEDNSQIVKYVPLEGFRREGENQCDVIMNCCNANAPRAFAMIPRVAYRTPSDRRIDVNLYIPGEAHLKQGKQAIRLTQETNYPIDDLITLKVNPAKTYDGIIALRIPSWSKTTTVTINGQTLQQPIQAGTYYTIDRQWKPGDVITLQLDMTAHLKHLNQYVAIQRGPVVLCRDTRFNDGFVDECVTVPNKGDIVTLTPIQPLDGMWMAFTCTMVRGTYNDAAVDARKIHLCDFASAGSRWDESERYRVWLPRIVDGRIDRGQEASGYW